ncbi:DUF6080 domain-containing protein [Paenibacillus endoradicis]|uniref:DUF6080 domain-containing protein n=1 Tax=Paenibacillus endoradicis TaxID=2972487 RepID=UPI0021599559|nr:DUF6080 domain-containing protein [Paenibacillus endoradicis]MCR8659652.1 DUF6080 domain-containing protein [Paenibacillus endoradicis]
MSFWSYILQNKSDNKKAISLFFSFFIFYLLMNYPIISYMKNNIADLAVYNPFYGAPFMLNLFNFDPSMYYGSSNTSIIHPFINFMTGSFTYIAKYLFDNLFFSVIQSAINALSVVMIYYYLRRSDTNNIIPMLFAAFFGISSYSIFTAFIPDSYPYVQFVIIFSVLYLQYSRVVEKTAVLPNASLALINFGLTSTNIVPFFGSLFFNMFERRDKKTFKRFIKIVIIFLLMVVGVTLIQLLTFNGNSWINNWIKGLSSGGFSYTGVFMFSEHWKAIYMLVISPILTPDITMLDPGIVAIVTDLSRPYPFYVHIIGFGMILLALVGFIKGIKSKETWILASYILFAILLHIIVGFGLAVFKYDLYLYAGHFIFAFFLLGGRFLIQVKHNLLKKVLVAVVILFALMTLTNNIIKHVEALNTIEQSYIELKNDNAIE